MHVYLDGELGVSHQSRHDGAANVQGNMNETAESLHLFISITD